MVRLLKKHTFSPEDIDLPEVQAFYCGEEPWEVEVAEWVKSKAGPNSVLQDMAEYGTEVWLHRDEDGVLVGYSSLGTAEYTWPRKSKKKENVCVLPFIGVHKQFQGEPKEADRDDKYAYQILDELLVCAAEKVLAQNCYPVIILSVDDRNKRAIQFYVNREFEDTKMPKRLPGVTYVRMHRPLDDLVEELRAGKEG